MSKSNLNGPFELSGRDSFELARLSPRVVLLRLMAAASLSILFVLSSGWSLLHLNGQRFVLWCMMMKRSSILSIGDRGRASYSKSKDFDWASVSCIDRSDLQAYFRN